MMKMKVGEKLAKVSAEIYYQTCDDKICLAPNTLAFEKTIESGKIIEDAKTELGNASADQGDQLKVAV